jgi:nitrogen regulatory protein PII
MDRISIASAGDGTIFVKDITASYDIGNKEADEKAALWYQKIKLVT